LNGFFESCSDGRTGSDGRTDGSVLAISGNGGRPLPAAVVLTDEMIRSAEEKVPYTNVNRTVASRIDTLTGLLGEYAFAQYLYGDWRMNRAEENRGREDFDGVEVKTSAFPYSDRLHLLVREDYAAKRKPSYYVQIIIDVPDRKAESIASGTVAYICGYATSAEVDDAPKRDFGSKRGGDGGYRCHYIPLGRLHPISEFGPVH